MAATDVALRLARVIRRHGVGAGLLLVRAILRPAAYRLCLFGLTHASARELPPASGDFEEHVASLEEIGGLRDEGWLPEDSLERAAGGDRCLVQRIGGRLAGLAWLSTRPRVELGPGVPLSLPSDAGYTYQSWTLPEFRGRSLQARRALALLKLAKREDRVRLMLFVRQTKFESLKGVRKAGYQGIGWIDVRERGGFAHWRIRITDPAWSGLVPDAGERGHGPIAEEQPTPGRLRS